MAILVGKDTRVVVQGITGREGGFHAEQMLKYGTPVVAGVTPGKGGTEFQGVPVYDSVAEAVDDRGADTVDHLRAPAVRRRTRSCEASAAGVELVICITEGVPTLDMARAVRYLGERGTRLIGPNCPGVMTPGEAKVGIMPANIFRARQRRRDLAQRHADLRDGGPDHRTPGLAVSTCVGIGGDPIIGTTFVDVLEMFRDDADTGGGPDRRDRRLRRGGRGGLHRRASFQKPVVGVHLRPLGPARQADGPRGAIISGTTGTPQAKVDAFVRTAYRSRTRWTR